MYSSQAGDGPLAGSLLTAPGCCKGRTWREKEEVHPFLCYPALPLYGSGSFQAILTGGQSHLPQLTHWPWGSSFLPPSPDPVPFTTQGCVRGFPSFSPVL